MTEQMNHKKDISIDKHRHRIQTVRSEKAFEQQRQSLQPGSGNLWTYGLTDPKPPKLNSKVGRIKSLERPMGINPHPKLKSTIRPHTNS